MPNLTPDASRALPGAAREPFGPLLDPEQHLPLHDQAAGPRALPTVNGSRKDITHFFELMPARWYSMALCDPNSFPQPPCPPDSDTNSPHGSNPGGGAAFLELQFHPPGFAPFADALSCDNSHWCAALTIDSLERTVSGTCNNNCAEPVNFAFIQTNGVPAGPAEPAAG